MRNGKSELVGAPPPDPVDWDAVGRYLAGESSDLEAATVSNWLAANPRDADLVAKLDAAIQRHAARASSHVDVESALVRVRERRAHSDRDSGRGSLLDLQRDKPRQQRALRYAIAASAIIAVGLLLWRVTSRDDTQAIAERGARTFETAVGARDSLSLPDGTRVVLGPRSRLVLSADYGGARREMDLNGEAYFDVIHDNARPFIVHAGGATIHDLGTTFSVRSDAGEGVRVVVTSGTVRLGVAASDTSGVMLGPGDIGTLRPDGQVIAARAEAAEEDLAWAQGRLVFRDAPLPDVVAALRRWYGVELRIADTSLANRHLTTSFAGEPIERVVSIVSLMLGARVEHRGDTVILRAAPGGARPK